MQTNLITKYNVPGPRYTSYPTVPYWDVLEFKFENWIGHLKGSFNSSNNNEGIGLYIHLPFCESLCTFCGCNKRITKNHNVESVYIEYLLKEWNLYLSKFNDKPIIKEIHLGGGTPTFFSPKNLNLLISSILNQSSIHKDHEFGFEGHPNNTTKEHLKTLYSLGFRRCSFGVQDYDPIVQKTINRIQPFSAVKQVTVTAREIGYTSVSHDLVFGLPFQKLDSIKDSIQKTNELKPDRISFYSYAHVPWIKGVGQRGYSENDLPKNEEKRRLYEFGRQLLEEAGYLEIGMDHFALKTDHLYTSFSEGKLHRNFMGYASGKTSLMIGLGVSAIGDSTMAFGQNEKSINDYYKKLDKNEFPIFRGHILTEEDLMIRQIILDLMCRFQTNLSVLENDLMLQLRPKLEEFIQDEIISLDGFLLKILPEGIPFVRNICMVFDLHLWRNKPESQLFSMTI